MSSVEKSTGVNKGPEDSQEKSGAETNEKNKEEIKAEIRKEMDEISEREVGYLSDDEDDNIIGPARPQKFMETLRLEFNDLTKMKGVKIACMMMVKNEKKRIHVSLESVVGVACCYIIFDTGSEDNTIDIITEHCKEHKINLYLIEGNFVDFSKSRNCLLDYADAVPVDYLLLLDCNDELRGGPKLLEFAKKELTSETTAYLLCQQWWSGKYDYYWNCRFLKARSQWRYICVVHEVLQHPKIKYSDVKVSDEVVLYQDRTKDDDKTGKRFVKDKAYLRREYRVAPRDGRTVFYLAQTYACLHDWPHAYRFYRERYDILDGFWEERYQSAYRCGEIASKIGKPWPEAHEWLLKAYTLCDRAEPLVEIAEHYNQEKVWSLAYLYAKQACDVGFPFHCSLFIDKNVYDYLRFSKLGILAYYYGKYAEGKWACEKALENKPDSEVDRKNLKFYLDKDKEIKENKAKNLNKNEYFRIRAERLRTENPRMRQSEIQRKVKLEWKTKSLKL